MPSVLFLPVTLHYVLSSSRYAEYQAGPYTHVVPIYAIEYVRDEHKGFFVELLIHRPLLCILLHAENDRANINSTQIYRQLNDTQIHGFNVLVHFIRSKDSCSSHFGTNLALCMSTGVCSIYE